MVTHLKAIKGTIHKVFHTEFMEASVSSRTRESSDLWFSYSIQYRRSNSAVAAGALLICYCTVHCQYSSCGFRLIAIHQVKMPVSSVFETRGDLARRKAYYI